MTEKRMRRRSIRFQVWDLLRFISATTDASFDPIPNARNEPFALLRDYQSILLRRPAFSNSIIRHRQARSHTRQKLHDQLVKCEEREGEAEMDELRESPPPSSSSSSSDGASSLGINVAATASKDSFLRAP